MDEVGLGLVQASERLSKLASADVQVDRARHVAFGVFFGGAHIQHYHFGVFA
jgi:hypothetical protein